MRREERDPEAERAATEAALSNMAADGANLNRPLEIDFHVAVPTAQAGEVIAERAREIGFSARLVQDEDPAGWTVWCSSTMLATASAISECEQLLDGIAEPHGGYIDGWGSWSGSWPKD